MTEEIRPLDTLKNGEVGVIHSVEGGHGLERRLSVMGLRPGTPVRLLCLQPARGPVVVEANGNIRLALGRGMARKVLVSVRRRSK